MSGRNSQVARILCLLDLLDGTPSGLTVSEIYERVIEKNHEASKRTIYRDLDALAKAGFPLFPEGDEASNQKWKLERNAKINQYLILSARELFVLYLARGVLTPLKATPFFEDLERIFSKLEEKLGMKQIEYLHNVQSEIKFEPGPQWGLGLNPDVLETVRTACSESKVLECSYSSVNSNRESDRTLGPHYLYYSKGGLYLVAEDLTDSKVKVFALPRLRNAKISNRSYAGNVKTPEDIFNGAIGVFTGSNIEDVVIEFEREVAQYVRERRWHSSQRVTQLENGRIRVSLELSQCPELFSWILSFGPRVKVLTPISLAEKIAVMAIETANIYKNGVA